MGSPPPPPPLGGGAPRPLRGGAASPNSSCCCFRAAFAIGGSLYQGTCPWHRDCAGTLRRSPLSTQRARSVLQEETHHGRTARPWFPARNLCVQGRRDRRLRRTARSVLGRTS